jgi:hypothetical protein
MAEAAQADCTKLEASGGPAGRRYSLRGALFGVILVDGKQTGVIDGKQLTPCCASRPCGINIVARWLFAGMSLNERSLNSNFCPRLCAPGGFPELRRPSIIVVRLCRDPRAWQSFRRLNVLRETSLHRVSHQGLVAYALLRVSCLRLPGGPARLFTHISGVRALLQKEGPDWQTSFLSILASR